MRSPVTWVLVAATLAGSAGIALFDYPTGGDDIAHFHIAKAALERPDFLLDIWGRPGFTLLHALPAQLGWTACRFFSLLVSVATAAAAAGFCRGRGIRVATLAAGFTFFQTWFFELSFGTLTETLFAAGLGIGLLGVQRGRGVLAALAFSFSALTRLEGIPLLALFAVHAAITGWTAKGAAKAGWQRRGGLVLLLGIFPFSWNLGLCALSGFEEPLALWTSNPFRDAAGQAYGSGSWWDYVLLAPENHGPVVLVLLLFGIGPALRDRMALVPLFVVGFYGLQSVLWAGGLFASAGYGRFMACTAPAVGILAAFGAERCGHGTVSWFRWLGKRHALSTLVVVSALWCAGHSIVLHHFHDPNFVAQDAIAEAIRRGGGVTPAAPLVSGSSWALHRLKIDPWDERLCRSLTLAEIAAAPPGAWIIYTGGRPSEADAVSVDLFFEDARTPEILELRRKNQRYAHRLKKPAPGFRLVTDASVLTRFSDDPAKDPWPYHAFLFVKTASPPR